MIERKIQLRTSEGVFEAYPIRCEKCQSTVEGVYFLNPVFGKEELRLHSPIGAALWDMIEMEASRHRTLVQQ